MKIVVIGGTGLIGLKLVNKLREHQRIGSFLQRMAGWMRRYKMLNLEPGDRIELFYEHSPASPIRAMVRRLLSPRGEAMSDEVEEYIAGGIEIILDESSETDVLQFVLLGTDIQYG